MTYNQHTAHQFERFGPPQPSLPTRRWIVAMMCSVFLGAFGVDRFYMGHTWLGLGKLFVTLMSFGFLSWVWWAIDVYLVAKRKVDTSGFQWDDEQPHYNKQGLVSAAPFDYGRPYTAHQASSPKAATKDTATTSPSATTHDSTPDQAQSTHHDSEHGTVQSPDHGTPVVHGTIFSPASTGETNDSTQVAHYVAPSSGADREPLPTSVLNADSERESHDAAAPEDSTSGTEHSDGDQKAVESGDDTDQDRP